MVGNWLPALVLFRVYKEMQTLIQHHKKTSVKYELKEGT
jgi:hypothetical protein